MLVRGPVGRVALFSCNNKELGGYQVLEESEKHVATAVLRPGIKSTAPSLLLPVRE